MTSRTPLVRISDMTAAAFAGAAASNPVILLPLGSHEDHGPHLPMGDFALAEMLAARMAAAAQARGVATYVAPTLPFGVADYFADSPGAIALSPAAFKAVLGDVLSALAHQHLTRVIILNGHGGNVPVIHEVSYAVKNATGRVIPSLYLWKIARGLMETRLGPEAGARFGHGAEPLASLSLALVPEPCDFSTSSPPPSAPPPPVLGLPVTGFGTASFYGLPVDVPTGFGQVPDDAIRAAAPAASAELGQAVADALVAHGAAFIAHYAGVTGSA